ncbi:MAG: hypothetical protein K2Q20_06655 [Phycisphaerales bacterium]|nr:hypothetical protein [Phycisphaerales bacterium]
MSDETSDDRNAPVRGCEDHLESADADCPACLSIYGMTLATPGRHKLMHPAAIRGRFKKGQSGNPSGPKPGSRSLEQIVKSVMSEVVDSTDPNVPPMERLEILGRVVAGQAIQSKPWAVKLLVERLYPKRVGIDLLGAATINVTFDDQDRDLMDAMDEQERRERERGDWDGG